MIFEGFSQPGVNFLKDLASNNNKEWFENNRTVYETHLLEPLRQLSTELGPAVKSIDQEIETSPTVNKTISKIYRDTRFSKDKQPFRTGLWLSFRRPNKVWGNVPEFYFYFTPEEYQYGMGFYSSTPANMEKFRSNINLHPEEFSEIINFYRSNVKIKIGGEDYKKKIANSLPEEFQSWYQKRNLYISYESKIDKTFFSPGLKDEIKNYFIVNSPLYQFIIDSIGM